MSGHARVDVYFAILVHEGVVGICVCLFKNVSEPVIKRGIGMGGVACSGCCLGQEPKEEMSPSALAPLRDGSRI